MQFYTLGRDGNLLAWKWVDDFVTDSFKNMQKYSQFKSGFNFIIEKKN